MEVTKYYCDICKKEVVIKPTIKSGYQDKIIQEEPGHFIYKRLDLCAFHATRLIILLTDELINESNAKYKYEEILEKLK